MASVFFVFFGAWIAARAISGGMSGVISGVISGTYRGTYAGTNVLAVAPIRLDTRNYLARTGKVDVHLIGTAGMATAPGESPKGTQV